MLRELGSGSCMGRLQETQGGETGNKCFKFSQKTIKNNAIVITVVD